MYIYRGLWLLKSDLDQTTIYESIKSSFNSNDDFLIFEIEQSPLGTLSEQKYDEILNLLTGVLHGYTTLQLRYALSRPDEVRAALSTALDTVLTGLHQKYDQHKKEHL